MPKRKLAEALAQTPVSYAGLSRIVECLRDAPLTATSRSSVTRAVRGDVDVDSPYGKVLQPISLPLVAGGNIEWFGENRLPTQRQDSTKKSVQPPLLIEVHLNVPSSPRLLSIVLLFACEHVHVFVVRPFGVRTGCLSK